MRAPVPAGARDPVTMRALRRLVPGLVPVLVALALSGCALERPASNACPALRMDARAAAAPVPASVEADVLEAMRAEARGAGRGPVTFQIITLSAGGQYGAFGAGFLRGWAENPVTPAPGLRRRHGGGGGGGRQRGRDPVAPSSSRATASTPRSTSTAAWRNPRSCAAARCPPWSARRRWRRPAPLEAFLDRTLTPALMDRLAARHAAGDRLLIGATNIDTGRNEVFDLGAAAAAPDAAGCLREAMLASGAIPGVFPPRHINGALYADGGLRDQVFLRAVDTARARVARETGREIRVEAFVVVNGALRPPGEPAEDRLLGYIARSLDILADEVLRESITATVRFAAARPGWRLRGIAPETDFSACGFDLPPSGTFDLCVTRTLFDAGRAIGRTAPIDWLSAAELRDLADEL